MATTSIADKLAKLEKKIDKRQITIAEEQKQLEKLREGEQSDDTDNTSTVSETAVKYSSFPRNYTSEGALN